MSFNYKEYLRDNPLLKEGKYEEFLEKEQDIFTQKPSYNDYVNKVSQAKKHIDLAMKNNIGNSITHVLDFIINNKGTKEQLSQELNKIPNKTEKETALQLLDDPKYGGKLN
jgi:uncharacterized membrane protein YgaE (UPF0421/DUF939 family)